MARKTINSDNLYDSLQYGFSHATSSQGKTQIHLSGQLAWDKDGNQVGDDLATQAKQVFANLTKVLDAAGATVADVVRMRTYVVDLKPADIEVIGQAIAEFYGDITPAANTLLGV